MYSIDYGFLFVKQTEFMSDLTRHAEIKFHSNDLRRNYLNPLELQEGKMKKLDSTYFTRRDFLVRAIPACAISCLGVCGGMSIADQGADPSPDPEKHRFDKEFPYPLTLRQYFSRQLTKITEPLKAIENEIGEKKLLPILHEFSIRKSEAEGGELAKKSPNRDFCTYCDRFRTGQMKSLITYVIVEDSEKAFEINVSECILVQPMLELNAGRIGNALLCDGDYGNAQGFNPKIKLIRNKTLMLGHDCCNHRYVLQG